PDVVISGAEQLLDHERALLTEVFGTNPFSKYSAFEVYEIASECSAHKGMHIQAEDIVVEVVNEDGSAAAPDRMGRVIVTNLHNYAMPFIRYELGDLAAIDPTPCECGRHLPRLVGIVGRMSELIVTPSDRRDSCTG
ncbi:MAG: phenylacetate--CoA ligase family protein, partial [Dehalococcoidia bacterium]|nr:phenylacetate--CoA ligase family protein [Dehalococcoidia bacterium]